MNKKEIAGELVTAVVYAALGLVLCFNPGMSIDLICAGAGVAALAYGAFSLLMYLIRGKDGDISRFTLPIGIAFAALGLFCLIAPGVVVSVIPLIFGIVLLIDGAGKLLRALEMRRAGLPGWGIVAAVAGFVLVFGLMMVTQPHAVIETVVRLFGALLVADGLIDLYLILRVYRQR